MKIKNVRLSDFIIEEETFWKLQKVVYFINKVYSATEPFMYTNYVAMLRDNKYFLSKRYYDLSSKISIDFYLVARKYKLSQ